MTMTLFAVDFDEVKKHRQLWLDQSSTSVAYSADLDEDAKHLVWIYNDQIAGIASIVPDMKKVGADNINWRLRGMAIDPTYRGNGKGEEFLQAVLDFAKKKNIYPLYGAARQDSTQMYEKLGAIICHKTYEIGDQGSHVDFIFA